jgi:hypothetical protein
MAFQSGKDAVRQRLLGWRVSLWPIESAGFAGTTLKSWAKRPDASIILTTLRHAGWVA